MKLIGLTGGIGCGKTTVLQEFQRQDIPCFVADTQAARYYQEPAFLEKLRILFGKEIITTEGTADKIALAQIVFHDKTKLAQLNQLVHPRVWDDFIDFAKANRQAPFVIFESAILYEYHFDQRVDKVICVYLDFEERMRRLLIRDKSNREALLARMNNQLEAEEKLDRADYVILNYEGNPRSRQVEWIRKQIESLP